jgi:hypothetical protein
MCDLTKGETAMRKFLILAFFAAPVTSAFAEDVFVRPESCVHVATIQFDTCEVDRVFRCEVINSTLFWVERMEDHGLGSITIRNQNHAEHRLLEGGEERMTLSYSEAPHPRDILEVGNGERVASGVRRSFGTALTMEYREKLRARGDTIAISGHEVAVIVGQVTLEMPLPLGVVKAAVVYGYLADADLLVELEYRVHPEERSKVLRKLSLLGEEGFEDEHPRFGCGELARLPQVPRENHA